MYTKEIFLEKINKFMDDEVIKKHKVEAQWGDQLVVMIVDDLTNSFDFAESFTKGIQIIEAGDVLIEYDEAGSIEHPCDFIETIYYIPKGDSGVPTDIFLILTQNEDLMDYDDYDDDAEYNIAIKWRGSTKFIMM